LLISLPSVGFQIGGQTADVVLLIMNEGGVSHLPSDKFTLGGEATATAGSVGRTAQVATDAQMHAHPLLVPLDGSVVKPDKEANESLYGRPISDREILVDSKLPTPSQAKPLMQSITRHMDAAAAHEQAEKKSKR
jgi:lipid-binding SYLF domain-containing protein